MPERKDGTGSPEMSVGRLPAAKIKGMDNILSVEEGLAKECESR